MGINASKLNRCESKLDTCNTANTELTTENASLNSDIEKLTTNNASLNSDIKKLNRENTSLKSEIEELKVLNESLNLELTRFQASELPIIQNSPQEKVNPFSSVAYNTPYKTGGSKRHTKLRKTRKHR